MLNRLHIILLWTLMPSLMVAQKQSMVRLNADTLGAFKKSYIIDTSKLGIKTVPDSSLTTNSFRVKGGMRVDSSYRSVSTIYIDNTNQFVDRSAIITTLRNDTTKPTGVRETYYDLVWSRGDSGATFSGYGVHYMKVIEDTSNGGSNGRKRGALLGITMDLVPYTENTPYTANRDVTGLSFSNRGSVEATEPIYIGGSRSIPHTSANPYGYAWGNGITIEDTLGTALKINGQANLGINLSNRGRVGNQAYAIQTAVGDTSIFGTLGVGVNPPVASNGSLSGTLIHVKSTVAGAIPELKIEGSANGTGADINIYGKTAGGTQVRGLFRASSGGEVDLSSVSNHPFVFFANNSEKMRLTQSGQLALGMGNSGGTDSLFTDSLGAHIKRGLLVDGNFTNGSSTGNVIATSGLYSVRASDTVGLASALAGKQASGTYLIPADSTSLRAYSNSIYLKNADSSTERTYSNSLYLKNADSTTERTYSNSLYPAKTVTHTIAGTSGQVRSSAGAQDHSANTTWTLSIPDTALLSVKPNFTMTTTAQNTTVNTVAQSQDTSASYFSFTNTSKPLFNMVGTTGNGIAAIDSTGSLVLGGATRDSAFTTASTQGGHFGRGLLIDGNLKVGTGTVTQTTTLTSTGGTNVGINGNITANPSGADNGLYQNFFGVNTNSANAQSFTGSITLEGLNVSARHQGTNNVVGMASIYADTRNTSSGTVSGTPTQGGAYGVNSRVLNLSTGSITNAFTYYASIQNSNASGVITNAYGLYIDNYTRTGSINHAYGVYQVEAADTNYFNGFMGIGTAVPSTQFSIAEKLNINSSGQVTKVNNVATAGSYGVATIVAKMDSTGRTANIAATTLLAVSASGAGMYRISSLVVLTTAGSVSSTLPNVQVVYTDNETGGTVTLDATPVLGVAGIGQTGALTANTIGTTSTGVVVINAKASTNIQVQTVNYASSLAGMQYAFHVKLEAL